MQDISRTLKFANERTTDLKRLFRGPLLIQFHSGIEACEIMDARLLDLSAKFRTTKFVKCKASDAIKNYPDDKCPTLLVYKGGKIVKQFVGLHAFGSKKVTADDIEWALKKINAVESDMVEPPRPEDRRFAIRRV